MVTHRPLDDCPVAALVADLKILGFCDWYTPEASGGAERAAREVYRRLAAAGARVRVISAAHGQPHDDPGVEVHPVRGWNLTKLVGGYVALAPGAFVATSREIRGARPAVLHSNTIHYTGCVSAAQASRRTGIPLVVTAQLGALDHLPATARIAGTAWERTLGRFILRQAAVVLAVSATVREHVISLGADPSRVRIAHNGVDHDRFALPTLDPTDRPLIVAVGRLLHNKGPDLLVEAARLLRAEGLAFGVAFLGDGPARASLERRVAEVGLRDVVSFPGHVGDVERWLSHAEIVVRASYTEGLSLAIIEAMAAGRCNVVSDIPPNRELIDDGRTGLVFRCGDAADLARALRAALVDPELRRRLAISAAEACRSYTWDRMAAIHAEAFAEVAADP